MADAAKHDKASKALDAAKKLTTELRFRLDAAVKVEAVAQANAEQATEALTAAKLEYVHSTKEPSAGAAPKEVEIVECEDEDETLGEATAMDLDNKCDRKQEAELRRQVAQQEVYLSTTKQRLDCTIADSKRQRLEKLSAKTPLASVAAAASAAAKAAAQEAFDEAPPQAQRSG